MFVIRLKLTVDLDTAKEYAAAIMEKRKSASTDQSLEPWQNPTFDNWVLEFSRRHDNIIAMSDAASAEVSANDLTLVLKIFQNDLNRIICRSQWKSGPACLYSFAEVGKKCRREKSVDMKSVSFNQLLAAI